MTSPGVSPRASLKNEAPSVLTIRSWELGRDALWRLEGPRWRNGVGEVRYRRSSECVAGDADEWEG